MTADDLRNAAGSVAEQLRAAGVPPESIESTSRGEKEVRRGFLQLQKDTVLEEVREEIGHGWHLYSQSLKAESGPNLQWKFRLELWLAEDGRVLRVGREEKLLERTGYSHEKVVGVAVAEDDVLDFPCRRYQAATLPRSEWSSSSLWDSEVWSEIARTSPPYEETMRLIDAKVTLIGDR